VELRLIVGKHDFHLGNITCGGHRRQKYRPTDKMQVYYNCLFHSRELYLPKTKSVVYGTANFNNNIY